MKRTTLRMTAWVALIATMLVASGTLAAQHQAGGQMPMTGPGPQERAPGQPPMMGGGMMGSGTREMMCPMMGGGMMPMMQQMMGGQTDPSAMGMMGGGQMDQKMMGRMLQLRGEMLRAVGEVLLKHGKAMEESK